jgi:hypothetical protein
MVELAMGSWGGQLPARYARVDADAQLLCWGRTAAVNPAEYVKRNYDNANYQYTFSSPTFGRQPGELHRNIAAMIERPDHKHRAMQRCARGSILIRVGLALAFSVAALPGCRKPADSTATENMLGPASETAGVRGMIAADQTEKMLGPEFETQGVRGTIAADHAVSLEKAVFSGGMLSIQHASLHPRMTLFLRFKEGVIPAETALYLERESSRHVHIHLNYTSDGQLKSEALMRDYELRLQFDAEEDGFLPGTILLNAPNKGIRLAGRFRAEIRGLRLVDGRPDLHSDHHKTLEYAAQLYLQRKLSTTNVLILKRSDARYSSAAGWGSLDVEFRAGDQLPAMARLQLLKGDQGWEVKRELPLHQLALAHPVDGHRTSNEFEYMAAVAIEKELSEKYPGKGIFWLQAPPHTRGADMAHQIVRCRVEGVEQIIERNYLFRRAADLRIVGTIGLDETIDFRSGEIVRKQ